MVVTSKSPRANFIQADSHMKSHHYAMRLPHYPVCSIRYNTRVGILALAAVVVGCESSPRLPTPSPTLPFHVILGAGDKGFSGAKVSVQSDIEINDLRVRQVRVTEPACISQTRDHLGLS